MFCSHYPSPVGRLTLVGDGPILTGLYLEKNCPAVLPPEGFAPVFPQATHWLDLYFQGIAAPADFPLAPQGTPFQQEVWNILRTVPFGRTLTYGAVAQMLGRPMSPQAVGGAVGRNPISITPHYRKQRQAYRLRRRSRSQAVAPAPRRSDFMTINEYQKLAMTTLNPALDKKDVLINGVMGLCGESGEVIDIVKKWLAQGHELDRDKLIRELGDVAWYLAETAFALDVPLEEVLEGNIRKLKARYPDGFRTEDSLNRKE